MNDVDLIEIRRSCCLFRGWETRLCNICLEESDKIVKEKLVWCLDCSTLELNQTLKSYSNWGCGANVTGMDVPLLFTKIKVLKFNPSGLLDWQFTVTKSPFR